MGQGEEKVTHKRWPKLRTEHSWYNKKPYIPLGYFCFSPLPLSAILLSFNAILLFLLPFLIFFILLLHLLSQQDHPLLPLVLTPYSLWFAFALCSLPWLCLDSAACWYKGRWIEAIFFLFLSFVPALQFSNSYFSLLLPPLSPSRNKIVTRFFLSRVFHSLTTLVEWR